MNKTKLKAIVASLMIRPDDYILDLLIADFNEMREQLALLKTIDIENVVPMYRIHEEPITFLRPDEIFNDYTKAKTLTNAPAKDADFVLIKRVVD